ncbi:MAG: hypothetical protein VYA84_10180 [Planctomycetota bacterium]|nr:hypothetical protein [Planctomycetota bacterium]
MFISIESSRRDLEEMDRLIFFAAMLPLIFLASVSSFEDLFDPSSDLDDVVIDCSYTRVSDQSGLETINLLAEKYAVCGKRLHLTISAASVVGCLTELAILWKSTFQKSLSTTVRLIACLAAIAYRRG